MSTKPAVILQDVFLNQVRTEKISVVIHLVNGFQLKGEVKGFDNFTVILDCDGKQMMVYKHAISSITPSRPVFFNSMHNVQKTTDANEKE